MSGAVLALSPLCPVWPSTWLRSLVLLDDGASTCLTAVRSVIPARFSPVSDVAYVSCGVDMK